MRLKDILFDWDNGILITVYNESCAILKIFLEFILIEIAIDMFILYSLCL